MINSVEILKPIKGKFQYANKLFRNNKSFEFKPGINVIIGKNATGKSTLLNMLKYIALCKGVNHSHAGWVNSLIDHTSVYGNEYEFINQVDIKGDYRYISFNQAKGSELQEKEGPDKGLIGIDVAFKQSNSSGEKTSNEMSYVLGAMFTDDRDKYRNGQSLAFEDCFSYYNKIKENSPVKILDKLLDYYKRNQIDSDKRRFTLFMDEPDTSLDLSKIKQLLPWFTKPRDDVQIIAILHNPFLIKTIYKKNPNVNFISFTKGYLDRILKEMESIEN